MDCEKQRISCFKNCYITYTSRTIIFLLMPYGLTDNRQSSCCGKKCKIPKVTLSMDLFSFSYFGSNEIWHQFFMLNILYWTFWKVIDKTFMMEILPVNPPHNLWILTPKNILLKKDFLLNNKTMILIYFFKFWIPKLSLETWIITDSLIVINTFPLYSRKCCT